jgi:hypothetical protein
MVGNQQQGAAGTVDAYNNLLNSQISSNNATNANNVQLSQAAAKAKQEQYKNLFDAGMGGAMASAEYFGKSGGGGGGGGSMVSQVPSAKSFMKMAHGGEVQEQNEEISLLDFLSQQPGMMMSKSPVVPGIPVKKGDHEDNDVVPALLSPGEIVIPRSHAADPKKAAAFARAVAARKEHK